MAGLRFLLLPFCAIAPGCLVVGGNPPAIAHAAKPAARSAPRFAEMISAPGQTIAKSDAPAKPETGVATPAAGVQPPQPNETRPTLAPPALDPPLVAALRAYLENRPDLAAEYLRSFDPANRDLLAKLLPAAVAARGGAPDAEALDAVALAAAKAGPIKLRKACFVSSVKQFGVYDPLPDGYAFLPGGAEGQLYLELANVVSEPTDHPRGGPGFVVRADCTLQVTDERGQTLSRFDPTNSPKGAMDLAESTRSPCRDFFLSLKFPLPHAPGNYTLTLDVREASTGRSVRHTAGFRVRP